MKPPKNCGKGRDKWTLKGKHPKHVHVLNQSDTKNAIETQTPQLYFDSLIINRVLGLFAERHFAERHFAERHFAERHFAEWTFWRRSFSRTDVLPNGHFAEQSLPK